MFLDFDGTLVELASDPDLIEVPGDLVIRLEKLADRLDGRLALISGRATTDLERHLGQFALCRAGSHGIARFRRDGTPLGAAPSPIPDAASRRLREYSDGNGLRYESKSHGAAVHYRSAPDREHEICAFVTELADKHGLDVKRGKAVFELTRPGADKGGAVRAFMAEGPFEGAKPIFIGDDVTDDDGFEAVRDMDGVAILAGDRDDSSAQYRLQGVAAVHDWLNL